MDEFTPESTESAESISQQPSVSSDLLSNAEARCAELEDQLKRAMADYQNLQRRAALEREQLSLLGGDLLLRKLFPALENYHYAWQKQDQFADPAQFIESLQKLHEQLLACLSDAGYQQVCPAAGEPFEASCHEAVTKVPHPELQAGTVLETLRPGYQRLGGQCVLPAQVVLVADQS